MLQSEGVPILVAGEPPAACRACRVGPGIGVSDSVAVAAVGRGQEVALCRPDYAAAAGRVPIVTTIIYITFVYDVDIGKFVWS